MDSDSLKSHFVSRGLLVTENFCDLVLGNLMPSGCLSFGFGLEMPELRLQNAQENGAVTALNQNAETLQSYSLALESYSTVGVTFSWGLVS